MVLEMESEKISETIKEGSLEAKLGEAQTPCNKSLKVSTGSVMCENDGIVGINSSKKVHDSNVGGGKELGDLNSDGFRAEGFRNVKELLVGENVAENEINKGSLQCGAEEGNVVIKDNKEVNNGDLSVLEVDTTANDILSELQKNAEGNKEPGMKKIMPEVDEVKGRDELQFSAPEIKDSGHGITLFVEVFGPLNGIKQNDDPNCQDKNDAGRSSSELERVREDNDMPLSDNSKKVTASSPGDPVVGEPKQGTEVESAVDSDLQCSFNIGDLVWVKTKTQLWWPGVICDPSYATKDITKSDKRDGILVKHFGNANFVWCCSSELKPFLENLEHMSKLNNSRSFVGAIEKAIGEFGRRVKVDMTCSCFSKGSKTLAAESAQSKVNLVVKEKTDTVGHFSASRFESATFLASVRNLARCISIPGKIDLVITQNCLSAFYHSLGHLQLPVHQLRPTTEDKDRSRDGPESERKDADQIKRSGVHSIGSQKFDLTSDEGRENDDPSTESKYETGYRSRERRKSKYLSYPYVNDGEGPNKDLALSENGNEDPKDGSCLGPKADSISSQCAVSPPITKSGDKMKKNGSRKPVDGESRLCELQINNVSSAKILSDLHLTALVCVYPTKSEREFLRQFVSSFRQFAFLNQKMDNQQESSHEILNQELSEASGNNLGSGGNHKRLGTKKKKVNNQSAPAAIGVSASENVSQEMENDAAKTPKVRKKRKSKAEGTSEGGLPDLNGSGTNLSVEDMHFTGPAACQGKLKPKRRKREDIFASGCLQSDNGVGTADVNGNCIKLVPLLQSMQATLSQPNNSESINETATICLNSEWTARPSDATEHIIDFSSSVRSAQHMDLLTPRVEPKPKKRKKKEETPNFPNTDGASTIPDLNGNVAESITSGKDLPGVSSVLPGLKPPRRRRRRNKTAAAVPEMNNSYSLKMENHIEALGGVLHLNFVSGYPLPSKEQLVSTFSMFGPLKELETQVLSNSTAQVVFVKSSDAGLAYRSLEKTNPFGTSLASFRLNYLSSASRIPEQTNNLQMLHSFQSMDGRAIQANLSPLKPHNGDAPDLHFIKRNLDMMKSMLEKAGDNLSPETKAKLENEIKGFMTKVSSLVGSSST